MNINKEELKSKWIKTLRGEGDKIYKQGEGQLKSNAGYFCCLGVCLDIIDSDNWVDNFWGYNLDEIASTEDSQKVWVQCGFPKSISKLFNDLTGTVYIEGLKSRNEVNQSLTCLNDSGFTFSQIADVIEHFL